MRIIGILTALFVSTAAHAACTVDGISSAGITGFQEAVISVADLDAANETWQTVGGYEVICDGPVEDGLASFWGLPEGTPMHQVVLRKGADRGLVRRVKIYGLPQVQIRSSGMPWDHGGFSIFTSMWTISIASLNSSAPAAGRVTTIRSTIHGPEGA
jgi:hypothetical protein